jgi:late competence protein required for DNA uptake (superfamily II DNA/RNA helicase)
MPFSALLRVYGGFMFNRAVEDIRFLEEHTKMNKNTAYYQQALEEARASEHYWRNKERRECFGCGEEIEVVAMRRFSVGWYCMRCVVAGKVEVDKKNLEGNILPESGNIEGGEANDI